MKAANRIRNQRIEAEILKRKRQVKLTDRLPSPKRPRPGCACIPLVHRLFPDLPLTPVFLYTQGVQQVRCLLRLFSRRLARKPRRSKRVYSVHALCLRPLGTRKFPEQSSVLPRLKSDDKKEPLLWLTHILYASHYQSPQHLKTKLHEIHYHQRSLN